MRAAGLKAISTVVSSSAIMIKSKHPSDPKLVDLITARIRGVISTYSQQNRTVQHANIRQLRKSTSSAHTTSSARSSTMPAGLHPETAHPPSLRSRRAAGSPSLSWCHGRRLPLSWTSLLRLEPATSWLQRSKTREQTFKRDLTMSGCRFRPSVRSGRNIEWFMIHLWIYVYDVQLVAVYGEGALTKCHRSHGI
jgi:hypothetical protein